jgi:hypothetical protein
MLNQTLLTFKGALGYITRAAQREEEGDDSGISSRSESSDEEKAGIRDHYTSTGILAPAGQSLNEITVTRLTHKQVCTEVDAYRRQCIALRRFCRLFDSKALVRKSDALSEGMTKVPPKEVQSLALQARELFLHGFRSNTNIKPTETQPSKKQVNP